MYGAHQQDTAEDIPHLDINRFIETSNLASILTVREKENPKEADVMPTWLATKSLLMSDR